MKQPKIPWTARIAAWWHESTVGHRVTTVFKKGRYRELKCNVCNTTFHEIW